MFYLLLSFVLPSSSIYFSFLLFWGWIKKRKKNVEKINKWICKINQRNCRCLLLLSISVIKIDELNHTYFLLFRSYLFSVSSSQCRSSPIHTHIAFIHSISLLVQIIWCLMTNDVGCINTLHIHKKESTSIFFSRRYLTLNHIHT